MCEFIYTHFYYYVKMLKQTYFVRELAKRAASSGCSCPAVLLLLRGVCVLHLFASFVSAKVFCTFVQIHSIWHPLPVTSSSFCCCYCCIASLNTLANILALFFPTTSFRCLPPFAPSVGSFGYSMLFFDFAAQLDFPFYQEWVESRGRGGEVIRAKRI